MSRYDIPALLDSVDLNRLVARYPGEGRRSGDRVLYRCPAPDHEDNKPSFTVSIRRGKQVFRCWSQCDKYGDAIDLIEWLEKVDKRKAIENLADHAGASRLPHHALWPRNGPNTTNVEESSLILLSG